jgi:FixJ family two-component response regulator
MLSKQEGMRVTGSDAKGLTNREIANHFCLSEQTVKNHFEESLVPDEAPDRRAGPAEYCAAISHRTQRFLL